MQISPPNSPLDFASRATSSFSRALPCNRRLCRVVLTPGYGAPGTGAASRAAGGGWNRRISLFHSEILGTRIRG